MLPKSQALIKSRSRLKILNLNRLLLFGKTGITEKAENSGNHSAEFHSTAQCSGDANSCIRERANSLKRRGTYVTVPLPFPSNLFYCSTLSPLICWWKMYSMWKIESEQQSGSPSILDSFSCPYQQL